MSARVHRAVFSIPFPAPQDYGIPQLHQQRQSNPVYQISGSTDDPI